MIKVNLTPFEELENPYWWVPDATALAIVVALSFGSVYFYVSTVENEIATREAEKVRMVDETTSLQTDVNKFNDLNTKITTLDARKNSLKNITQSKLLRYLPVILLENIQNLKPEKVWLTALSFEDKKLANNNANNPPPQAIDPNAPPPDPNAPNPNPPPPAPVAVGQRDFPVSIEISGSATDNVAIAEFMMGLKATQNQSFESSDLRTQLFFSEVGIQFSQVSTDQRAVGEEKSADIVNFKLVLSFKEKTAETTDAGGKFSKFIEDFRRDGHASMN